MVTFWNWMNHIRASEQCSLRRQNRMDYLLVDCTRTRYVDYKLLYWYASAERYLIIFTFTELVPPSHITGASWLTAQVMVCLSLKSCRKHLVISCLLQLTLWDLFRTLHYYHVIHIAIFSVCLVSYVWLLLLLVQKYMWVECKAWVSNQPAACHVLLCGLQLHCELCTYYKNYSII